MRERPLPQPLPRREGAWSPRYPYGEGVRFVLSSYQQPYRDNLTYYAPSLRGRGWERGRSLMFSFFLSQNYTEEQKSQRRTETLSQPITQNDITKISRKALWYLSSLAGVCGFSLWAKRLLFICENLWETKSPTSFLRSKICEKKNQRATTKKLAPWHQPWWQGQETKIKLPMYRHWYHINGFPLET